MLACYNFCHFMDVDGCHSLICNNHGITTTSPTSPDLELRGLSNCFNEQWNGTPNANRDFENVCPTLSHAAKVHVTILLRISVREGLRMMPPRTWAKKEPHQNPFI